MTAASTDVDVASLIETFADRESIASSRRRPIATNAIADVIVADNLID